MIDGGLLVVCALGGAIVGTLTGMVPGLHVNTLAAAGLAVATQAGPAAAAFLVAVGTVHTIVNIVPSTFMGAPDEDDVLVVLPAHRLLLAGRGLDAVQVSVRASMLGMMLALAASPGYRWLLAGPVGAAAWAARFLPYIVGVVLTILVAQEARRGVRAAGWSAAVLAASGALGLASTQVRMAPLVSVEPSPLLPLLGGLFGAAGLLAALRRPPPVPDQKPPHGGRRDGLAPVGAGVAITGATALLPGMTAAVAGALLPRFGEDYSDDERRALRAVAGLSAINTSHAVLSLVVLMAIAKVRTGLADVVAELWPTAAWTAGTPSSAGASLLTVVVLAGFLGAAATWWVARFAARHVHRLPGRVLSTTALATMTALVIVLCGLPGLHVFMAGAALGSVPLAAGIRRVHLVGCLLIPVLWWSLT